MNANELADELDVFAVELTCKISGEAATMLRQQQAEIEALKQIIDANNLNQNIGQFVKPANEPVAWMLADKEAEYIRSIMAVQHDFVPEGCVEIPLYTHPVKELTDEEIFKTAIENGAYQNKESGHIYPDDMYILNFARAILRKAQEK